MKHLTLSLLLCIGLASSACGSDSTEGDGGPPPTPDGAVGDTGTPDADLTLPDATPDADAGTDAATMDDAGSACPPTTAPPPRTPDMPTVLTDCRATCARRDANRDRLGLCAVGTRSPGDCLTLCAEVGGFTEATETAAEACFLTDPLCFVSLTDCILHTRYASGTEVSVRLSGSGFADSEGQEVVAGLQVETDFLQQMATICDGSFEFSWTPTVRPREWVFSGAGTFYIDANMNGMCDPAGPMGDRSSRLTFEFDGNLDDPGYTVTIAPPLESRDSDCRGFM